jgi:hypothetical protein
MRQVRCFSKYPAKLAVGLVTMGLMLFSAGAFADETAENEESYYENPAQAAHAAQLADEAALSDADVQQALNDYEEALDALGENPTEAELAEVQALEEAYQEKLSEITGVMGDEIEAMRASGMGWGDIAHELGVHPSVLGLGHTKGKKDFSQQEIAEATARNTKNGSAKGHGLGIQAAARSAGQGLGLGKAQGLDTAKGGNIAGAAGLGGSKGNSASAGGQGGQGNSGGAGNAGGNAGGVEAMPAVMPAAVATAAAMLAAVATPAVMLAAVVTAAVMLVVTVVVMVVVTAAGKISHHT